MRKSRDLKSLFLGENSRHCLVVEAVVVVLVWTVRIQSPVLDLSFIVNILLVKLVHG